MNSKAPKLLQAGLSDAGVGRIAPAYRYLDPRTGLFDIAFKREEACSIADGKVTTILVHLTDGRFDGIVNDGHCNGAPSRRVHTASKDAFPQKHKDGFGYAYRYFDRKTGRYKTTDSELEALAMTADLNYQAIWVVYRENRIDHVVTQGEYQNELERTIGKRIRASYGLDERALREFERLGDKAFMARWLEKNCPDYKEIVRTTIEEMGQTAVVAS